MGKKLSTPEVHSALEAARKHYQRSRREQAEAVARLLAYKKRRAAEIKESHTFRKNARINLGLS